MKRVMTALLLILLLVFTALQGCNTKSEGSKKQEDEHKDKGDIVEQTKGGIDTTPTMGRFMEQKVDFPEFEKDESVIKILQNSDNQIELYTKVKGAYFCYLLQEDMSWERSQPGWLNDGKLSSGDIVFNTMCLGEDGSYYLSYSDYNEEGKCHIIKSDEGGKESLEVELPYLSEKQPLGDVKAYPTICSLKVLENGNLALFDLQVSNSLFIFSPQGEKLDELLISGQEYTASFIASKNDIITAAADNKGIIFYDTVNKGIRKTIEYDVKQSDHGLVYMSYAVKKDGTTIMGNSDGIHRLMKDGTLWETTVDGDLNSMSMPTLYFDELFVIEGEEEEYYASYMVSQGGYQLMHYVFDKNISSVPATVLTVYSLLENNNIRQAISLFQANNTDVKVNYVVAMGEEGGTVSDYIRALNTELLNGSGADILLLDGLPVDSYLEKGVLADLSDIIEPMEASGELLNNISGSFRRDGKIFYMPMRIGLPISVGDSEAMTAIKSLNGIVGYINQNKGKPFTLSITYQELLQDSLALYSGDLYNNNEMSGDQLKAFLNNVKTIADNINATEYSEDKVAEIKEVQGFIKNSSLFQANIMRTLNNKVSLVTNQINSIYSILVPIAIAKEINADYTAINQMFLPNGLVGLKSASKEKDMAKEFIRFLFSKEVQDANLNDGFPVNMKSLEQWIAHEDESYFAFGDENGIISATWPHKEERQRIQKIIQEVNNPILIHQVIYNIILEEAIPFLRGDIDADQAAAAALSKINTYLAE